MSATQYQLPWIRGLDWRALEGANGSGWTLSDWQPQSCTHCSVHPKSHWSSVWKIQLNQYKTPIECTLYIVQCVTSHLSHNLSVHLKVNNVVFKAKSIQRLLVSRPEQDGLPAYALMLDELSQACKHIWGVYNYTIAHRCKQTKWSWFVGWGGCYRGIIRPTLVNSRKPDDVHLQFATF